MKLPNFKKTAQKGFTLIELLVVIGILGILIAGVLAALDPIEQINRGSDANTKRASTEIYGALSRYFAVRQAYPWNGGACTLNPGVAYPLNTTPGSTCVQELVDSKEFKSSLSTNATSRIRLTMTAGVSGGQTLT